MENRKLYRLAAEHAPVLIWISSPDGQREFVNRRWLDFTGRRAQEELGSGWMQHIHPDDLQRCRAVYSEGFGNRQEFKVEYRLRRHDGEFRWLYETGSPLFESDGVLTSYIGSCFDITGRKLAEEALSRSSARLIEAQEHERVGIARELHDDFGASLAVLAIEILKAGEAVSGASKQQLQETCEKLQELASRVSRLSHRLHSPMLQYMGLAKAIDQECRDFSEKYHIPVSCACKDIPAGLDSGRALMFLRVVQEALENAGRHSRAAHVIVDVIAAGGVITLQVSDNGVGFDVDRSRIAQGVGLISMRERMRLIGGGFEILSQPGKGSQITCRAPLGAGKQVESMETL